MPVNRKYGALRLVGFRDFTRDVAVQLALFDGNVAQIFLAKSCVGTTWSTSVHAANLNCFAVFPAASWSGHFVDVDGQTDG